MSPTAFGLILTGVLLNAAAQLLLKAGVKSTGNIDLGVSSLWTAARQLAFEPHILGGLACYVLSVGIWIVALSRTEVSIAYPMLSVGYIVTAVAAWWWLGENMTTMRIVGIVVIIAGVWLVARS